MRAKHGAPCAFGAAFSGSRQPLPPVLELCCISACAAVCAPRRRRQRRGHRAPWRRRRRSARDWLDAARELQSAKGAAADSRELQRARTTTYERRPRARRRRARRRGPGAGSRRARSLPAGRDQVLLCRGRCIECRSAKIENDSKMAMPMPGARVRAAGAGATPCPRKSVPRSSVHTSFQQYILCWIVHVSDTEA